MHVGGRTYESGIGDVSICYPKPITPQKELHSSKGASAPVARWFATETRH